MRTVFHLSHALSVVQGRFMLPESTTASLHDTLEQQPSHQIRRQTWNRGKPKFVNEALGAIVALLKKGGFTKAAKAMGSGGKHTEDFTLWLDINGNETEVRLLVGVAVRDASNTQIELFDVAASDIPESDRAQVRIKTVGVPDAVAVAIQRLRTPEDSLSVDEIKAAPAGTPETQRP
jgi:hypothetical protein